MSFLKKIEVSFQEAETFLQASSAVLKEQNHAGNITETIKHIQIAKQYVANLREDFPAELNAKEDTFIAALKKTRSERTFS